MGIDKDIRIEYSLVKIHAHFTDEYPKYLNIEANENMQVYGLGENSPYYCIVDSKEHHSNTLIQILQDRLQNSYLLVHFNSPTTLNTYFGIEVDWLYQQIPVQIPPDTFEESVSVVLDNWKLSNSLLSIKYLAFQKSYSISRYKNLLVNQFLFDFLYFFAVELTPKDSSLPIFKVEELKKVMEIEIAVTQDFYKPIPTVKEMATMAGMSISKFKILFEDIFKQSPHQYILNKKLLYARDLLQSGQYNITQVAYKLGYNHASGFSRVYKNKFKDLPSNLS